MIVLSVDSSSSAATVALVSEESILGEITLNHKKQHSILLMPMIDSLLKYNELSLGDIDGFVISKGPGSFTGLRIGMATIKGLSLGSNKPCISISNLDGLAYNVFPFEGIICPIMDALRNNVYTCIYKNEEDNLKPLTEYMVISLDELIDIIKKQGEKVIFVGDGTEKHRDYLNSHLQNATFAPYHLNYTRASSLGELGVKQFSKGISDNINISAPLYLRKSQAEREYDKKMGLE
ncbi:tRNA (adenosine(37)-N6)-threonylcarbamoyltransferase complex dimerization subunit type 1 TsaB [Clostridium polyendosporum]|uniref:tRNA (Adenosine(37)-N6)-threonylcarbamoyltransferase complex dimerization subunit type 1 TsaB n=1 Tax=Clostridium polyendosporum TaxID=69208 RepID=A0A919S0Z6_9CLOT|nr:tRNA (adenosine(37)-N6)-threonylcarbamoyltransferase complex dimerization subunit type 1 TsaB [Clostridium polyendosporum]GIM29170.1 tRNA (adenosine(37)-N6)-threonylcarbamoyltransferase complex dimerization subunit type 1 TsaB [Clostridium polyendosporum]